MEWITLVGAALGAVIALSGALLTSIRSGRDQLSREREARRRQVYADFAVALDSAHAAVRAAIGTPDTALDKRAVARAAVSGSGLYRAREHLLMFGSATVAAAGELAFHALIQVRDVAEVAVDVNSESYHEAYHDLASELWNLRMVVREDLGERPFVPSELGREDWSERRDCPVCGVNPSSRAVADPD